MSKSCPPGWTTVSPSEIAAPGSHTLGIGPFGSDLKVADYTASGVPLVFVRNIRSQSFGGEDTKYISIGKASELRAHRVQPGDVLITKMGDPPGDSCVYPDRPEAVMTADCIRWRIDTAKASPRFVAYAIQSPTVRNQILGITKGVAQRKVSLERFLGISVPLAPLPEQHQIVEAIESHFSRLDEATALLKHVKRSLNRYGASVLKAAIEGQLVPTEAEVARSEKRNYEPASVLLQRILVERRLRWKMKGGRAKYVELEAPDTSKLPVLPEGWCWAKVSTVGDVQLGRQRAPQHHAGPNMRPYLRVANVFEDRIDTTDVMWMNFEDADFNTYRLEVGDILLNEGQSPHLVGRPAIYRGEVAGACFTNTLVRFRALPGVDPRYALAVFRAQLHSLRYMQIAKITTNIAHLGAERFADVEFPLPPLAEQQRIVAAVDDALSRIAVAEQTVAASLTRVGRLRQSILKWAFEGRLVEQNPNDEPASALLTRIRQEKDGPTPKAIANLRGRAPRSK